jgi:hypothetical protein
MNTELQPTEKTIAPRQPTVPVTGRGLQIQSMDDLWRFSKAVSASGLAPKGIQTPEAVFVAVQMGLEMGLPPMAALQNIAVINGRPSLWGDAQTAVVRATGELEVFAEWFENSKGKLPRNPTEYTDDVVAVCRVKRAGMEAQEVGFSVKDAKNAGLWGKEGPWKAFPFRMLKARARSFALRDQFGDALRGMLSAEEVQDLPTCTAELKQVEVVSEPVAKPKPVDKPPFENLRDLLAPHGLGLADVLRVAKLTDLEKGSVKDWRDLPPSLAKEFLALGEESLVTFLKGAKK